MSGKRPAFRWRAALLILATALGLGCLGAWSVFFTRLFAEAPIVAFGQVAPQLARLRALWVAYLAAGIFLCAVTLRLAWLAGREVARSRRKREAERLFEN